MRRAVPAVILALLVGCASIPLDELPQRDLVTLGDSVTMGVGAGGEGPDPSCFDAFTGGNPQELLGRCDPSKWIDRSQAYPYLVAKGLTVKHANFALAGAGAADVRVWVAPTLALRPKYVTLFIGANDLVRGLAPEAFAQDVAFVLGRLGEDPAVRVFVLNLPDVWRAPRFVADPDKDVTEKRVAAFNVATKAAVETYKATLVDISGPDLASDPALYSSDSFHPGPLWHERVKDRLLAAISARR